MVDVTTCILSSNFDFSSRIADIQTRSCIELDLSLFFATSTMDFKSSLNLSIEFQISLLTTKIHKRCWFTLQGSLIKCGKRQAKKIIQRFGEIRIVLFCVYKIQMLFGSNLIMIWLHMVLYNNIINQFETGLMNN